MKKILLLTFISLSLFSCRKCCMETPDLGDIPKPEYIYTFKIQHKDCHWEYVQSLSPLRFNNYCLENQHYVVACGVRQLILIDKTPINHGTN